MTLTIAIVGRPNVGKSTLFNRLVGRRLALVDDTPGVTRDRREGDARIAGETFRVIDTAGLDDAKGDALEARMRHQTEQALEDADVVLLLYDARAGVTPLDKHFADWLRERGRPVILGANKCESTAANAGLYESYSLGFGDPVALSAEHGDGMADLLVALLPFLDAAGEAPDAAEEEDTSKPLQLAIIGRPNTGKSTLVNRLIDEDRLLTGPEAGITRDSITVDWTFDGRPLQLVDTAGLRRRARINDKLEKLSTVDTMRTIRYANVAVLMLDAAVMLEKQDLTIGRQVIEEGRALVIAANKWDAVTDRDAALRLLRDRLQTSMPQVRGIPVVTISALEGRNLDKLMHAVFSIYDVWNKRVSTARLNAWLDLMVAAHPPPLTGSGRRIRLRYMTQVKSRPPTFAIWASRPEELPDSYQRYLVNGLREDFGFEGVPLRLQFRKGKNPYVPETAGGKGKPKTKHSSKTNPRRGGKRAARPRMKPKSETT